MQIHRQSEPAVERGRSGWVRILVMLDTDRGILRKIQGRHLSFAGGARGRGETG